MGKKTLPQVSAPFKYVLGKLKDNGIDYKLVKIKPTSIKPIQTFVFSDVLNKIDVDNMKPIWISKDYYNLDGHHRYTKALSTNAKDIKAVKLDLNKMDAIEILNEIMDSYEKEFDAANNVDEVVAQDVLNNKEDDDTRQPSIIEMIRKEISEIDGDIPQKGKTKTITGYRKKPLKENSKAGNFFYLKSKDVDTMDKYEIEFNNLLDTNSMNLVFNNSEAPVSVLAKIWFPNIDFEKVANKYNVKPESIMNRAICEKANKMGYDGIKYGDVMVQGFN